MSKFEEGKKTGVGPNLAGPKGAQERGRALLTLGQGPEEGRSPHASRGEIGRAHV